MTDHAQQIRIVEALLFASTEPQDRAAIAARLPEGSDLEGLLAELVEAYANRGVNLHRVGERWTMRTAPDLAAALKLEISLSRKPSRAATETLSIIAYHQPATRAEIEEIRSVSLSPGTLDFLMERGWIKPGRRRPTPGRPLTFVTTDKFLEYFGLENLADLPGVNELKAAGLLDARPAIIAIGGDPGQTGGMLGRTEDEVEEIAADDEETDAVVGELPLATESEIKVVPPSPVDLDEPPASDLSEATPDPDHRPHA